MSAELPAKTMIRKDDQVMVITGAHKGKKGRVVRVILKHGRVIVEGINIVKRHVKPTQQGPGRIVEKEASIHLSNVVLWNEAEKKPAKVGIKLLADGRKVRVDRRTDDVLDKDEARRP